jgi:hypothetical protein
MVETENGTVKGGDRANSNSHYLRFSKHAAAGLEFPSTVLGGMFWVTC